MVGIWSDGAVRPDDSVGQLPTRMAGRQDRSDEGYPDGIDLATDEHR